MPQLVALDGSSPFERSWIANRFIVNEENHCIINQ